MPTYNINELVDKIDYEKLMLQQLAVIISKNHPSFFQQKISVDTDDPNHIANSHIFIHDSLSDGRALAMTQNMSPLLFCAAYKCVDMIFEWVLEANVLKQPNEMMGFKRKVTLLNSNLATLFPQNLPLFFSGDLNIINNLFLMYGKCRVLRNAIVHGGWGNNLDGNLNFDFELHEPTNNQDPYFPNGRVQYNLSFEDVCNFASLVSICVDELVRAANAQSLKIYNIKYLLDKLQPIHQGNPFQANSPPMYCDIIYISRIDLDGVFIVDMSTLLSIAKRFCPHLVYYTLKIVQRETDFNPYLLGLDPKENNVVDKIINTWEIPSTEINELRTFLFDPFNSKWHRYKT